MKNKPKNYDFSGYATKFNVLCSDGRTIDPNAFKHQDGVQVPLLYHHLHTDVTNILGHAILEYRNDGMYTYGYFNDTDAGKQAKQLVKHGDLDSLSIFANQLKQLNNHVQHGIIRELSLVLAGANPTAKIDNISITHTDRDWET